MSILVWAWGRLSQDADPDISCDAVQYTPRLVESLPSSSVRSLSVGHRQVGTVTRSGDLYVWGQGFRALPRSRTLARSSVVASATAVSSVADAEALTPHELRRIVSEMSRPRNVGGIDVKDRRVRLRQVKQCFFLTDARRWLLRRGFARERISADAVLRRLLQAGLLSSAAPASFFDSSREENESAEEPLTNEEIDALLQQSAAALRFGSHAPAPGSVPLQPPLRKRFRLAPHGEIGPLTAVACGRKQTVVVDEAGGLWRWDLHAMDDDLLDELDEDLGIEPERMHLGYDSESEVSDVDSLGNDTGVSTGSVCPQSRHSGRNTANNGSADFDLSTHTTESPISEAIGEMPLVETSINTDETVQHVNPADVRFRAVAVGSDFGVALAECGSVFSWGDNAHGRLGQGKEVHRVSMPRPIGALRRRIVTRIACGWSHAAAVTDDGALLTWGCSLGGRLGDGQLSTRDQSLPSQIKFEGTTSPVIIDVACGYHHTLCVSASGQLYACGGNDFGQLGLGIGPALASPRGVPVQDTHFVGVAAGAFHSAARCADGALYTWGDNQHGQLGHGTSRTVSRPERVQALECMDVLSVECGGDHTVCITQQLLQLTQDYFRPESSNFCASPSKDEVTPLQLSGHTLAGTLTNDSVRTDGAPRFQSQRSIAQVATLTPIGATNDTVSDAALDHSLSTTNSSSGPIDRDEEEAPASDSANGSVDIASLVDRDSSVPVIRRHRAQSVGNVFRAVSTWFTRARTPSPRTSEWRDVDEASPAVPRPSTVDVPPTNLTGGSSGSGSATRQSRSASIQPRISMSRYRQKLRRQRRRPKAEGADDSNADEMRRRAQRERRLAESVSVWRDKILPKWDPKKSPESSRVRDLVFRVGVPPQFRGKLWSLLIGNALMVTPELFDAFAQRARLSIENDDDTDSLSTLVGREETVRLIETDLERTFPTLAFFQKDGPMHAALRRLLHTYCFYRPDVGYAQGMSYLAGSLLLHMPEFAAFRALANLLNSPHFHSFLRLDDAQVQARCELFWRVIKHADSRVHDKLREVGVGAEMFLVEWFMTLFAKRLGIDVAARVWDCFLVFGDTFAYRAAAGILVALRQEILTADGVGDVARILKNGPEQLREDRLFEAIGSVKLNNTLQREIHALGSHL
ncbi:MAG: hypothetical protein MHM6MM_002442 [Cercozoa sp. M6MM]